MDNYFFNKIKSHPTEKLDNGFLRNSPGWRIRRRFPGVHCPRRAPSVHSEERRVCKQVADKRKKRGLRGFIFLPYFRPYAIAVVIFMEKFATGPKGIPLHSNYSPRHCFRALEYNARGEACYLETNPATILRCPLRPATARQPVDERRGTFTFAVSTGAPASSRKWKTMRASALTPATMSNGATTINPNIATRIIANLVNNRQNNTTHPL